MDILSRVFPVESAHMATLHAKSKKLSYLWALGALLVRLPVRAVGIPPLTGVTGARGHRNFDPQSHSHDTGGRQALPPTASYERRVGVSLVRAAWERRPEGPAYLLSICDAPISRRPVCFLLHTPTPLDQWNSEGFSRVPADGFFLFLNFRFRI